jgi:hypothetical protein
VDRFLKFTTGKEPALTVAFVAAAILAVLTKVFNLTDDDLLWIAPVTLVIAGGIIRFMVYAPATVERIMRKYGLADPTTDELPPIPPPP